jgi:predicted aspartyl protease
MICPALDFSKVNDPSTIPYVQFQAIWDTGATATVITQKVIDKCGLKAISLTEVLTANGKARSEVYLVGIALPNQVGFGSVPATRGTIGEDIDVLIGMDIITMGDMAITNHGGKTMFSFRCPSSQHVRFDTAPNPSNVPKVGRNEKCPCGSGKKYKKCCGAATHLPV